MHYSTFTTSDKCELAFQTSLPLPSNRTTTSTSQDVTTTPNPDYSTCILLLHGFSGSSSYFTHNFTPLSAHHWLVAPDMRGHGRSGHNPSRGGFHVARLAADLRELLLHLCRATTAIDSPKKRIKFIPVGCSIGAAVVWTFLELFGEGPHEDSSFEMAGYVFVDQAPLQDRSVFGGDPSWDEQYAHRGCYDEKSMLAAQEAWVSNPGGSTHRGLVEECLGYRFRPQEGDDLGEARRKGDEEFFVGISRLCDGTWLARLLADHTRYDHREACEGITRPVLVMAGRRSGCFSLAGMEETVRRVRKGGNEDAEMMVFESGHWLFYEEPERFNRELLKFVEQCTK